VLFGTSTVDDAVLDFLAHPERDAELVARNAIPDWAQVMSRHFAVAIAADQSLPEIRTTVARQVLSGELLSVLGTEAPAALKTIVGPKDPAIRRRCATLAEDWRNRRDLSVSYGDAAGIAEKALHLESLEFSDSALASRADLCGFRTSSTPTHGEKVSWWARFRRRENCNSSIDRVLVSTGS